MSTVEITQPRRMPRGRTAHAYRAAVERVVARMRERADAPLNLAEMATAAGVSRCHFDRVFRFVTGLSPRRFQTALRLHAATRLLLTSERTVTEVCLDVGYESLGSFITKFTSTFGVSPQRLRQIADHFDQPLVRWLEGRRMPRGNDVRGTISFAQDGNVVVFIGLFGERIAEDAPMACAIVRGPGPFAMPAPPDGRYHAMAIGMRPEQRAIDVLLDDALPRGAAPRPVVVHRGAAPEELALTLRGPESIDPPVNLTLPLLLRLREAR
jgi:AraC-like DNA-binding protein